MAADGSIGASEVAWFPGLVQRAEGGRNVLGQLRACGGVDGIGAREAFEGSEFLEGRGTGIPVFFSTLTASDWLKPFCSRQCFRLIISGRGFCGMKV